MRPNLRLGAFFGGFLAVTLPVVPASASSYRVVYAFTGTSDGYEPEASLINVGGTLYGTTYEDSPLGHGTVFSVNPTTGAETTLYEFKGGTDGSNPYAGLIKVGGTLYGTTMQGGNPNLGTVFSLNLKTGAETVLYAFQRGTDGVYPEAALANRSGTLYGTTEQGGAAGQGSVFSVNRKTGVERLVYSFNLGNDGAGPLAGLIDVGGILYGTTLANGSNADYGTVFSVDPATGTEEVVHAFKGSDGRFPLASLINFEGALYGTTEQGGTHDLGTVFSLNPTNGALTVLYSFAGGSDGAYPAASLLNVGGTLFGTTSRGGISQGDAIGGGGRGPAHVGGGGTIFTVNPATGAETVVHAFEGHKDGSYPSASLINVGGALYGTTANGGTGQCEKGCGTVFAFTP